MAFISEWVKEEDWELYNSFELYYDHERDEANQNSSWEVDKERDIYFIYLGGGGMIDIPREYALIWEGKKVKIITESEAIREKDSGKISSHWKIVEIRAEKSLEIKEAELLQLIKEALLFYCEGNLIIDYMAEPVFIEGRVF